MSVPHATERVLSTMDEEGHRIKLRPRPSRGRFWKWRAGVAWSLIALFVTLPFLRMGGRPAFLIDLGRRQIDLLGAVFRPSDGATLMLLGLSVAAAIFLITALWGRVWCGWGCPQTVYMEWVFRPIERWIEGGVAGQKRLDAQGGLPPRRLLKFAVFAALAVVVGNVFLAYFVGVDRLVHWVARSPKDHPGGFLVMGSVSALMFLDFAWFREQTCIVACPYGRLQTMLIDRQSMVIGYDAQRGEPRGKAGKKRVALPVLGDCVDCAACVTTCPTGIDIREGLQMECINCAQCADACDAIMHRLGRKPGLIRYTSQDVLAGKPRKLLRPRTVIYPALLAAAVVLLGRQVRDKPAAEVWTERTDAPFSVVGDGRVSSPLRLRIENRTGGARSYTVTVRGGDDLELLAPHAAVPVAAGATAVVPVIVLSPASGFHDGERGVTVHIDDGHGFVRDLHETLFGPAENHEDEHEHGRRDEHEHEHEHEHEGSDR